MANPVTKASVEEAREIRDLEIRDRRGAHQGENTLSKADVIQVSFMLLFLATITAIGTIILGFHNPDAAIMCNWIGVGGTLIMGLAPLFVPSLRKGNATWSIIFSVFEGLMAGGLTFNIAEMSILDTPGWILVLQALVATVVVFFLSLVLYSSGTIRVTQKMRSFLFIATLSLAAVYGLNLLSATVFDNNFLFGHGWLPIIIAVVAIILAALSLINNFNSMDMMIKANVGQSFKWSLGQGFMADIVWMYVEILRLLFLTSRQN